jgi:hypothetical protein
MAVLSAPSTVKWRPRGGIADRQSFIAISGDILYQGAFVVIEEDIGTGHGYLKPLDSSSGVKDLFCGVVCNSGLYAEALTGDGTLECTVDVGGVTLQYKTVTGVTAQTNVGDSVFATDDNVLTLTDCTNMYPIGRIVRWYTGTYCDVRLYSMMEYAAILDTDLY